MTTHRESSGVFRDRFSDINPTQQQVTERRLSILGEWIAHFKATQGHLPTRLQEILPPDPNDPNFLPHDRWWRDGWDRQLSYRVDGATCELRSPGQDGQLGTPDDVVWGYPPR